MTKHSYDERVEILGTTYDTTTETPRPGECPDTAWMAMGGFGDDGVSCLVALVGFADRGIMRFAQHVHQKLGEPVPLSLLETPASDGPALKIAVFAAGLWPDTKAREVVEQLSQGGKATPRQWAKVWAKLRKDPDRIDGGNVVGEDLTQELGALFLQQCFSSLERGGAH
jgi:hypothetical protein